MSNKPQKTLETFLPDISIVSINQLKSMMQDMQSE